MAESGTIKEPEREREERWEALHDLESWLQTPMIVLSFVWLLLVLAEFVWGTSSLIETFGTAIWLVFLAEFGLRLLLAPEKLQFLRGDQQDQGCALPALPLAHAVRAGLRAREPAGRACQGLLQASPQ